MQGRVALDFAKANKIDWQTQTLEAWKSRMSRDYYMFHQLVTVTADADEDLNVEMSLKNDLADLFQHFQQKIHGNGLDESEIHLCH